MQMQPQRGGVPRRALVASFWRCFGGVTRGPAERPGRASRPWRERDGGVEREESNLPGVFGVVDGRCEHRSAADSNPRWGLSPYSLSRGAPSAALGHRSEGRLV